MTGNKNTNGAQLIVTTQDVSLLSLNRFRRDQICFVEKDNKNGVTDLYSLDEFAPRKNADIRRGYLQGRYGAIPAIGDGMVRRIRFTLRKRRKLPSNQRSAMLSLAIWCIVCLTQILTRSNSVKSMKRFLHFGYTSKQFQSNEEVLRELRKNIPDYEKISESMKSISRNGPMRSTMDSAKERRRRCDDKVNLKCRN